LLKVEALQEPLSIDCVRDGGVYSLAQMPPTRTNLYLNVGCIDRLYIKVPSERGLNDYRNFAKVAHAGPDDVRHLEDAERIEKLRETLAVWPDLEPLTAISTELAHYLAIHKLQYERLQSQSAVAIPRARFGALQLKGWGFLRSHAPALFQERIPGTTLWEMFDFTALAVRPQWRPFVPAISARLSRLMGSALINHIDWNIQNFVFNDATGQLFYVDLKPTTFAAKHGNEHNLQGIRQYYIV
jgi:hypothetical protein